METQAIIDLDNLHTQAHRAHPGALIGMRVDDSYAFFWGDAEHVAHEAKLERKTLRVEYYEIPVVYCPVKQIEQTLVTMVRAGFKVALCDPTN